METKSVRKAEDIDKVTNRDLMEEIKTLKSELQKVKNEVTADQPSSKFKVAKTRTDANNELRTVYHNETAKEVGQAVKQRGGVKTAEMKQILSDKNVDVSKPTVISIMRRYASKFDHFSVHEPKKGIRKSLHLKYNG